MEHLERAGVLGRFRGRIVAARGENDEIGGGRHAHLMRVDVGLDRRRLFDFGADGAVWSEPMNRQTGRLIVGNEQIVAERIDGDIDRLRLEHERCAERRQATRLAIDHVHGNAVPIVALGGVAVAEGGIEQRLVRMKPDVLHGLGHPRHALMRQREQSVVGGICVEIRANCHV